MFTATIYKVMIGSLSGAMEEVYVAKEIIRKWNQIYSEREKVVFLQEDKDCVKDNIDLIIGIIGNYIKGCDRIEDYAQSGTRVILLFQQFHSPENTIPNEINDLRSFKNRIEPFSSCYEFNGNSELESVLTRELQKVVLQ